MKILVDKQDEWLLTAFSWHPLSSKGKYTTYAHANIPGQGKPQKYMLLHHAIVGKPLYGLQVDHRNRNGLDCRRRNLRFVTQSTNKHNSKIYRSNTTGFKGVSLHKQSGKFMSRYTKDGKENYLGLFLTAKEAREARDNYIRENTNE